MLQAFDPDNDSFAVNVRNMIRLMGDNPDREGLKDTPMRVLRSYKEMFAGYEMDPKQILKVFNAESTYIHPVIVKDISFFSFCEHHLLPFFGKVNIGYIPSTTKGRLGLSKLPRLVDCFSKRLQVQERMTDQIANAINDCGVCSQVMVCSRARHMCIECRGVSRETETVCVAGLGYAHINWSILLEREVCGK